MSDDRVTRQCRRCGGWPRHASCTCLEGPLFDPPAPTALPELPRLGGGDVVGEIRALRAAHNVRGYLVPMEVIGVLDLAEEAAALACAFREQLAVVTGELAAERAALAQRVAELEARYPAHIKDVSHELELPDA